MIFKNKKTGEVIEFGAVCINASLVSAQNRKRLFWIGKLVGDKYEQVKIELPEDQGILLRDILEDNVDEKYYVKLSDRFPQKNIDKGLGYNPYSDSPINEKARALNTGCGGATTKNATTIRVGQLNKGGLRKLTPIECERLQSLPDNYTEGVSNTQRYKALGNGFNCKVIEHIINNLK